ncbi:MAG: methylenetetrahydrofolate--tRNA-(uracil(54)-C(5))-methyltransferase (FADH(2)-oxidizing) TrmFO [Clostridia bacterium]|nr:methylenetetrahydrofolate--tRNA-(uracil(54)-C(5))-methyltransferase (FADH(2)-oxidizing) TrmFO [Clostridia bacterium]
MTVRVIGAGLAGCEAAWQLTKFGISVELFEMKPKKYSPAHKSEDFCELVCSNSLKAERIENACGLLKAEMRLFDSVMMRSADKSKVAAGGAFAVDRELFSKTATKLIRENPLITVINEEVTKIDTAVPTIIATGPLTSTELADEISRLTKSSGLYFFDAAAPIVAKDSIDMDKVFYGSRYGRGTDDYINCPMTKDEYDAFYNELVNAQTVPLKDFEGAEVFEGCMPVEVMAKRGEKTLLFGPLKPVGLVNPKTEKDDSYAVVQLRQDNREGTLYNIVGFQTNLKWGEQKRVFSMIPGLSNAEFVRYGIMHRNTYLNSPRLLNKYYQMREYPNIFFAGQITGVEGYVESASSGILAGYNMAKMLLNKQFFEPDRKTMVGSLPLYISDESIKKFQPMNANFGIIEPLDYRIKNKQERYLKIAERAIETVKNALQERNENGL